VDPSRCSELVSLKTHEDRTLFFDFIQLDLGQVGTLTPKIHLYTVPGQSYYESSRKIVLKGADGVVFVADSSAERLDYNLQAWNELAIHLTENNLSIETIPLVIQFNKQDLPNALPSEILRKSIGLNNHLGIKAIAIQGIGVFETLKAITSSVFAQIQNELN